MSKTIAGTHADKNSHWQAWSKAAAYAESLPVGSQQAIKAWGRAARLWSEHQSSMKVTGENHENKKS